MWKDYSQNRDKGKMEEHNDLLPDVNSFSPQGIGVKWQILSWTVDKKVLILKTKCDRKYTLQT